MITITGFGCYGYGAYVGLHGKSIRSYPDVHEGVTADSRCLECHHPENVGSPVTPHPNFTGCIGCHNDEVETDRK